MINRSLISASCSRMSASSAFASFVTDAIRLQNISARSSRARVRATWTMHANSPVRFNGATFRITSASAAEASPAKSAIFDSAIPSSHTPVSPSESTHRRCSTCSRNPDHDAFPAGCFKRLYGVFAPWPMTSSKVSRRTRSGSPIRPSIRSNMPVFTSPRILDTISSSVENAGSSRDSLTSISRATLIKSGGSFLTSAANRIAADATARARSGSWITPRRSRTNRRCNFAVSAPREGAVPSRSARQRRTCSTTSLGISPDLGKYPSRWKHVSESPSVSKCSSERACVLAHAASSSVGLREASSRAVTRRRNRGYAVRSIDAIAPNPRSGPQIHAPRELEAERTVGDQQGDGAVHAAEATLLAYDCDKAKPQFAASITTRLIHLLGLSWPYPEQARGWVLDGTPSLIHRVGPGNGYTAVGRPRLHALWAPAVGARVGGSRSLPIRFQFVTRSVSL